MQKKEYIVWFFSVIFLLFNCCFIYCGVINEQLNTDTSFLRSPELDLATLPRQHGFSSSTPARHVSKTPEYSYTDTHEAAVKSPTKSCKANSALFEKVLRKNHEQKHKNENQILDESVNNSDDDSNEFYDTLNFSFSESEALKNESMFGTTSLLSDITEENTSDFSRVEDASKDGCNSIMNEGSLNASKVDKSKVIFERFEEPLSEASASLSSYSPDTSYSRSRNPSFSEIETSKNAGDANNLRVNQEKNISYKISDSVLKQKIDWALGNNEISVPNRKEDVDEEDDIGIETDLSKECPLPTTNNRIRKNEYKCRNPNDKENISHCTNTSGSERVSFSNSETSLISSVDTNAASKKDSGFSKHEPLDPNTGSNGAAESEERISGENSSKDIKIDINHNSEEFNHNALRGNRVLSRNDASDGDVFTRDDSASFEGLEYKNCLSKPDSNGRYSITQETDSYENHAIVVHSPLPLPNFSLHSDGSKCKKDKFFDSMGIVSYSESLLEENLEEPSIDECPNNILGNSLNSDEFNNGHDMISGSEMNISLDSMMASDNFPSVGASASYRSSDEECSASNHGNKTDAYQGNLNGLPVQELSVQNRPDSKQKLKNSNLPDIIILPIEENNYETSDSACFLEKERQNVCDFNQNNSFQYSSGTLERSNQVLKREELNSALSKEFPTRENNIDEAISGINTNNFSLGLTDTSIPVDTGSSHGFLMPVPSVISTSLTMVDNSLIIDENRVEGRIHTSDFFTHENYINDREEEDTNGVNQNGNNNLFSPIEFIDDSVPNTVQSQSYISNDEESLNVLPNDADSDNMIVQLPDNISSRIVEGSSNSSVNDLITRTSQHQDEVQSELNADLREIAIPKISEIDGPSPKEEPPNKPNESPKGVEKPPKRRNRILLTIASIIFVGSLSVGIFYLLY
ncbi:hypothetical protein CWI36_0249p0030 [Hamiltosporidium magnivora]|uniref:Uncharacterized protein n=1 Tax=Hamiltosporidium magnivora TaxID=148818 RepID=A0A4Q9LHS9_9MICR|nr:hypothetical protein CWI36_0249p0030 [Hamiltosporidium magnivora]